MTQKSKTMIAAIGPRKTAYALMKFRNVPAEARIFHGTRAQHRIAQSSCPRLMFTYWGNKAVRSLAAESELAEILTPRAANANEKAAKKRAARDSQFSMRAMGSQLRTPYFTCPALEAAMPMKAMKVKIMGRKGT